MLKCRRLSLLDSGREVVRRAQVVVAGAVAQPELEVGVILNSAVERQIAAVRRLPPLALHRVEEVGDVGAIGGAAVQDDHRDADGAAAVEEPRESG